MLSFKKNKKLVFGFLAPPIFLYVFFILSCVVMTAFLTFFKWKGVGGSEFRFVGLANYIKVFRSEKFWKSMGRLLYFVVISLGVQMIIGFILAYLVSLQLKGSRFFKLVYYLPAVLSVTAVSLMWRMILSTNDGMLNTLLKSIGLGRFARSWLTDPKLCLTVITLINSWVQIGMIFVILLAGIIGIPDEIYEAAAIDGVGDFGRIFQVTIPMMKDVLSVCAVMILANSMKTFEVFFVVTSGSFGPGEANMIPIGMMYNLAFRGNDFGRGSVISLTIMVMGSLVSSLIYFKGFRGGLEEV